MNKRKRALYVKIFGNLFKRNNHHHHHSQYGLKNIPKLFELDPNECNRIYIREKSPVGKIGSTSGKLLSPKLEDMRSVLIPKSKKVHEIDIEAAEFIEVKNLRRTFDIRQNDADYKPGDVINYREEKDGQYTGFNVVFSITYITVEKQQDGYIVMGIVPYSEKPRLMA